MDPVRAILFSLAGIAEEARLRWHAERAAVRARRQVPTRNQAFAHHAKADLCLISAVQAAKLPSGHWMSNNVRLSKDPVTAAGQLRGLVVAAYRMSGPIEAEHEAARLAYLAAFAEPVTDLEQHYVDVLAKLPVARRDKIFDLAEERNRHA